MNPAIADASILSPVFRYFSYSAAQYQIQLAFCHYGAIAIFQFLMLFGMPRNRYDSVTAVLSAFSLRAFAFLHLSLFAVQRR
jgi:hypothetical protein